ncbi:hypothetical protein [Demequina sp. NBRC 110057]|uniref:hypothetical protein n=1 Tax=Demequina sp. NBRC 110057 TaxID=1570346 RepID=UPI0009FF8D16|nr:hypothetical protein [Demequina sp. NBRC 110057]
MRARRQGPLLAALVGLAALVALPSVTAAAWTDDVWFSATASAGTWDDGGGGGGGGGGGIDGGDDVDLDITWNVSGPTSTCATVDITTDGTDVEWELTVDVTQRPWDNGPPSEVEVDNGGIIVSDTDVNPVVIHGNTDSSGTFNSMSNNTPLSAGETATVVICGFNNAGPEPQPDDGTWYTTDWSDVEVVGSDSVCSTLTVQGLVDPSDPFYYGWQTDVNVQWLVDALDAEDATVFYVSSSPSPSGGYDFTFEQDPDDPYLIHIESGVALALQGNSSTPPGQQQVEVCVHGSVPETFEFTLTP